MAFTGILGTGNSQLGQIILGSAPAGGSVSGSFTANAVLLHAQSGSFTADAQITLGSNTVGGSFTLDAVITSTVTISGSFTADALLLKTSSGSLAGNSVLKKTISPSLTADAIKRKTNSSSFTANSLFRKIVSSAFTTDAVLLGLSIQQHDRWTTHTGVDHGVDHILARAIGPFIRGTNLMDVLIDMDSRLTAREQQRVQHSSSLAVDAVLV